MNKLFVRRCFLAPLLTLVAFGGGCGQPLAEDSDADSLAMQNPEGIIFPGPILPPGISEQALSGVLLDVFKKVNAARGVARTCGGVAKPKVAALTGDSRLDAAAQGHSDWMASTLTFSHTGAGGSQPWDRVTAKGYKWTTVGENIAAGYSTADAVVAGWLASPGHCNNIMNGAFSQAGVGMKNTTAGSYHYYWTMVFAHP
jgi:uncharacterized protein YkwD